MDDCRLYALVESWSAIFLDEMRSFVITPSEEALLRLFLCSKVLLAQPFHGGKAKMVATERIIFRRLERWRDGQVSQLWADMVKAWERRRKGHAPHADCSDLQRLERAFRRAAALSDRGLPGEACRHLISRGVVTRVTEQMAALFPARREVIYIPPTATSEIDDKVLGQIIQILSRGLAPGPSGRSHSPDC